MKSESTHANVVQVPADFFDVDIALERYPSAPEPPPLRLRIGQRGAQKSRIPLAHLKTINIRQSTEINRGIEMVRLERKRSIYRFDFQFGDGGGKIAEEDGSRPVQFARNGRPGMAVLLLFIIIVHLRWFFLDRFLLEETEKKKKRSSRIL